MSDDETKRFWVEAHGCQMNVHDADRMRDTLVADGWRRASRPEEASLTIIAGCHIRARATSRAWGRLADLRARGRKEGAEPIMAIAGCVAQAEGTQGFDRGADLVIGPQATHKVAALARARQAGGDKASALDFDVVGKFRTSETSLRTNETSLRTSLETSLRARSPPSAFVTIQEGCDKFCSFCVVPYTRGPEVSRDAPAIETDVRALTQAGAREIVLLGQNVNAWRGADAQGHARGLGWLIRRVATIEGVARIRYTTSHPRDMDEDLLLAHADEPKLAPWFHLPVQSGSDRVLAAMNRRHKAADYLAIVARVRALRPDIAVSSDFIVGYPGETDADFAATMALVREVDYAHAYAFRYSPRPGAPSAKAEPVEEGCARARLAELLAALDCSRERRLRSLVGTRVEVLATRAAPGIGAGWLMGRTQWMDNARFRAPASALGSMASVRIEAANARGLEGRLVPDMRSAPETAGARA